MNKETTELMALVFEKEQRQCIPVDDKTNLMISVFLCVGLVISYLPQVPDISFLKKKSAQYLLL